jgi:hypothetical protein
MRGLGWLLVGSLCACGPEVQRPAPGVARTVVPKPAAPARRAPARVRAPLSKEFHATWLQQTPPFNQAVAIAPGGQIAVLATRSLTLHDAKTGGMVARKEVCTTFDGAFSFVDDKTGALVCEDSVRLFSLPDLTYRTMHALPDKAHVAAFAPGFMAVAAGRVRVLDTTSFAEKHVFEADGDVTTLALTAKWIAIGLERGEVLLYPLEGGAASQRIAVKQGFEIEALALSPDGTRVFASAGPVAGLWRTADGTLERRFEAVGAVRGARWLGAGELAVVGPDGLLLLHASDGSVASVDGSGALGAPFALTVNADHRVLCAAERAGKLACFTRGRAAPGRSLALDLDPASEFAAVMSGRVLGRAGARLRVAALPHAGLPEAGTDVTLLRYTEQAVGALRAPRWIRLAQGRVLKVEDEVVIVRLDSELVPLEGIKDPLTPDTPLRLAWDKLAH